MLVLVEILVVLAVVAGIVLLLSAQRRADAAADRLTALSEENRRLGRAVVVAEQALRSLGNDTRMDASLSLQVDAAIEDVRRAARGDDAALGG